MLRGSISPEQVAIALSKEGSKISVDTVRKVFKNYSLEKKTLDLPFFNQ